MWEETWLLLLSLGCLRNTCLMGLWRYVHFRRVKVLSHSGRVFLINTGRVWKIQFHPLGEFKEGPEVEREPGWTKDPFPKKTKSVMQCCLVSWLNAGFELIQTSGRSLTRSLTSSISSRLYPQLWYLPCHFMLVIFSCLYSFLARVREVGWIKKKYRIASQDLACHVTFDYSLKSLIACLLIY